MNGRLGQDLGFGGFAFALKLPELMNTNLAAVRAKLGQTSKDNRNFLSRALYNAICPPMGDA